MYRSLTGKSPTLITDLEKFDCQEQNQALIFDEAIPEDSSDREKIILKDKIKTWLEKESTSETKTFIIFTLNNDRIATLRKIIPLTCNRELKVINLNDRLTKGDRAQILYSHFTNFCPNKSFSEIEDLAIRGINESLGYPEICALICRCEDFQKRGRFFCARPLRFLKSYLENMWHSEKSKFLLLVYMSLNQMEIDVDNLNEMLFNELETCKSSNHTEAEPLVDTIIEIVRHGNAEDIQSLMPREFMNKVPYPKSNKYRLQHEVIKRMTLIVFGSFHFDKLLELTKRDDLDGLIQRHSLLLRENYILNSDTIPRLFVDQDKWKRYISTSA